MDITQQKEQTAEAIVASVVGGLSEGSTAKQLEAWAKRSHIDVSSRLKPALQWLQEEGLIDKRQKNYRGETLDIYHATDSGETWLNARRGAAAELAYGSLVTMENVRTALGNTLGSHDSPVARVILDALAPVAQPSAAR